MATKYSAPPSSPNQQRDRLCYLLRYTQQLAVDGLSERWNRNEAMNHTGHPMTWADRCAKIAELTTEMRAIINTGADRWIHPLLGTTPGTWTSGLLLLVAGFDQEMAAINPAEAADRTRQEDIIAAKATALGQRYAQLQSLDLFVAVSWSSF